MIRKGDVIYEIMIDQLTITYFIQDIDNNGDFWNRLEIYCRDLTKEFSDVRIISGPLWKPVETAEPEPEQETSLQNGRKRKPYKMMKYPVNFNIFIMGSILNTRYARIDKKNREMKF